MKAMYDKVTQKVKVGSILGEGFDTYYGVKQGDPLSTDLFGIILDEYLKIACPKMGVKVGSNYVAGKFYIDDFSLMTGNIEDLQKAFRIIENFCASFGFKVNINKKFVSLAREEPTLLTCRSIINSSKLSRLLNI